jgi:acylphosphatase
MRRVHLKVSGLVQSVGYRMFIHRAALELGLSGWVRNMPDGSVEIEAQGPEEKVAELIRLAGRGPSRARVSSLQGHELTPSQEGTGFAVLL